MSYDLTEYRVLKVWAEMFHDAQQSRIRSENRVRNAPVFSDVFTAELAVASETEHRIGLALRRQFRKTVPAGVLAWQKQTTGLGIDILARLVGHLGHPRIATPSHWEGTGEERKLVPDAPFERTVGQLWQYCGHGRPGRVQKGMSAEELFALGNPILKMLTHVMAECAIKQPGRTIAPTAMVLATPKTLPSSERLSAQGSSVVSTSSDPPTPGQPLDPGQPGHDAHTAGAGVDLLRSRHGQAATHVRHAAADPSTTPPEEAATPMEIPAVWPYRAVYEARRDVTADREHAESCVRCGPSGHPAQPGSPWSKAHQHADALRIVGKHILRDLWEASA